MSMRAPCLSEAVAKAYADPHSSCSASSISAFTGPPSITRRKRRHFSTTRSVILSLLLLMLALPIASAIFDPGQPDVVEEAPASSPVIEPPRLFSSGGSTISLIAPKGQPISLHPGCKRTSDLFDNVCQNPWSPFLSSNKKSHSASHSELVICPVGEINENGEKERVFAITGTITLPESTYAEVEAASSSSVQSATIGDKEAYWPKPGDEGFWRQRDGELEWVPTEVKALLESEPSEADMTPAMITKSESSKEESKRSPDAAHAEEYHAWSESVGGEESKTWLSFEQWRENHLAAEREQEKQRIAAGRKQKNEKAKEKKVAQGQASNATEKVVDNHMQGSSVVANATGVIGTNGNTNTSTTSELRPEMTSDSHSNGLGDQVEVKVEAETLKKTATEEVVEPVAVKADTSQDTGTIPAIGDPSSQLSTLKHRWNFASFDCAAVVHRANPSAKFTSAILSEKKDRYMLSPCPQSAEESQFVVVELCDEISVDTIVLANYEFFSRMFKRFRVRVARNLNGGEADWYDIGTFRARNVRGLQVFNTVAPTADSRFFRYVRIDFLEHYGSEFYCPVSLLRVYGLTQMDDYVREEEEMRRQKEAELTLADSESVEDEDEVSKEEESNENGPEVGSSPISSATKIQQKKEDSKSDQVQDEASPLSSSGIISTSLASSSIASIATASSEPPSQSVQTSTETSSLLPHVAPSRSASMNTTGANESEGINVTTYEISKSTEGDLGNPVIGLDKILAHVTVSGASKEAHIDSAINASKSASSTNSTAAEASQASHSASSSIAPTPTSVNASSTASPSVIESKERGSNATSSTSHQATPSSASSEAAKPAGSGQQQAHHQQQQQQQNAGGSESIYRTITKRLNTLEANATLSIQYMEHSRQQLGEVFNRMERNQRDKIAEMLKELNASNWRQIESLKRRQQVDLQQAIFEFDKHRQQTDAERRQLLAQVHILSSEVILEKRFGIAQLVLLLGLFVFMALTRGSKAAPLIHQGIARISSRSSPGLLRDTRLHSSGSIQKMPELYRHGDASARSLPSPSPSAKKRQFQSNRPFLTPRPDRRSRVLERAVPLRGNSHSKVSSMRKAKSINLPLLSPLSARTSTTSIGTMSSQQRQPYSAPYSIQGTLQTSPVARPLIKLDTDFQEKVELETPVYRVISRTNTFKREDTPTNLSEARQFDDTAQPLSASHSASALSESYGSDWGTERSDDDDDSRTSYELHSNGVRLNDDETSSGIDIVSSSPSIPPSLVPLRSPIHRIEESDAEEDSPKWNSVKSRRSIKRANGNGSSNGNNTWQPQSNGHSRTHTPPNQSHLLPTPTRRTFSPFHKNAEIEIN